MPVDHGHFAGIVSLEVTQFLGTEPFQRLPARHRRVAVQIGVVVQRHIVVWRIPGLVGIKAVHPEKPLVPAAIHLDKVPRCREHARRGPLRLQVPVAVVARVLGRRKVAHERGIVGRARRRQTRVEVVNDMLIDLVAALEMPAVKRIVEPVPTIDQVRRVTDQVRGPTSASQDGGQRRVIEPQRQPGVQRLTEPPRKDVGAMGDGRKAAQVRVVHDHRLAGERVQVGRHDPVIAVASQVIVAQGVDADDDNVHIDLLVCIQDPKGLPNL